MGELQLILASGVIVLFGAATVMNIRRKRDLAAMAAVNRWAACVEDLPGALPAIEVAPRASRADRDTDPGVLSDAQEFQHVDPAFGRRYRVVAVNHRAASDLLDAKVLRLLAGWPDFSWRIEGTRIVTWGEGKVKPHWVQTSLNMLVALAEAVPDEVWRTARERSVPACPIDPAVPWDDQVS